MIFTRHVSHAAGRRFDESFNSWIPTTGLVTAWLVRSSLTSGLTYTTVSVRLSGSVSPCSRATPRDVGNDRQGAREMRRGRTDAFSAPGETEFFRAEFTRAEKLADLIFTRAHARVELSRCIAREIPSTCQTNLYSLEKICRGIRSICGQKCG